MWWRKPGRITHGRIAHIVHRPPINNTKPTRRRKDSPSHIVLALQIKDSAFGAGASVGTVRHRMTTKYKIVSPNTGYRVRTYMNRIVSLVLSDPTGRFGRWGRL